MPLEAPGKIETAELPKELKVWNTFHVQEGVERREEAILVFKLKSRFLLHIVGTGFFCNDRLISVFSAICLWLLGSAAVQFWGWELREVVNRQ